MATFTEGDVVGRLGGGGMDGGMGGIGGGLLLGLLLGRGGLLGNEGRQAELVTQADLNAQSLGDIKASIPYNEAQVQLALAQAMASLTTQNSTNTQNIMQNQQAFALSQANLAAALSREIGVVDTNVDRQSTAIQQTIFRDGEATRALITSNRIADLEQQLTVSQLRENEQRGINRDQVNSHNITIQMQQQQQQQQLQMRDLQYQLGYITQRASATNSTVQVGNTGAATAGAQTANPTNVVA